MVDFGKKAGNVFFTGIPNDPALTLSRDSFAKTDSNKIQMPYTGQ